MKIRDIITSIEAIAPLRLQEDWDNAGLIAGDANSVCSRVLCTLDVTPEVVDEAIEKGCNLIVAHHPIIFTGLKKLNGQTYAEQVIIKAIKNDVAIYAAHTNLDNVLWGVSGMMAEKLGLKNVQVLAPRPAVLRKLVTFAPADKAEELRQSLFAAGAGDIGNYSECSFSSNGTGSFKAGEGSNPYAGEMGKQHQEEETRIEVVFPFYIAPQVIEALLSAHPYEEVAYDIFALENTYLKVGAGAIGELESPVEESFFLEAIKATFGTGVIRHSPLSKKPVKKIALCGGSGAFMIKAALAQGADFYITADIKYHEFFDAGAQMVIADIGHYESEQFSIDQLYHLLVKNFPTFAVLKTGINTNPVRYFK